jgi:hypothetical protein
MTCHELREALVDHARGVLTGAGSRAAIESHLEYCHGCATEHARQRALTEGLRAVAKAAASESAPAALEGRLIVAFAAQHAERQPAVASGKRRGSPWLAAAASIAIVVGLSYVVVNRARPEGSEVRLKPDATNEVRPEATEVRLKPDATEVRLKPDATEVRLKPDVTNTKSNRGTRRPSTTTPRAGLRIEEFVALPGAIGLPTFESGRIVRVDIPVSSLPAYGVELVPDAVGSEVQADVIVGQDGQARAIRFVTTSSSRSGVRP